MFFTYFAFSHLFPLSIDEGDSLLLPTLINNSTKLFYPNQVLLTSFALYNVQWQ